MSEAENDRDSSDSGAMELPPALIPRPAELDLSAVITCYFEEQSIDEFYTRLSATLESTGRTYEIIFINDGSTDATWDRLRSIFERDPRVSAAVDLFRNTGQTNAATPGMMLARGRAILLIDSDLQLDPEELPKLLTAYDAGAHIVSGYRLDRKGSTSRRLPSLLANIIMRRASGSEIRDFGCTYKIYDARLVKARRLNLFGRDRFVRLDLAVAQHGGDGLGRKNPVRPRTRFRVFGQLPRRLVHGNLRLISATSIL